jgi:type 1 glutamine amidotransferase
MRVTLRRRSTPVFAILGLIVIAWSSVAEGAAPIRVLILSGANNHDWRQTTPALRAALEKTGRFDVSVTETPEKLTAASLEKFDVVVSNYNTFTNENGAPREVGWGEETKKALLDFVRNGKGYVTVHAGSCSFYDWAEYQRMALGTWEVGRTGHGKRHEFKVKIAENSFGSHLVHPIISDFKITDELWHGTAFQPESEVIATAFSSRELGGSGKDEPVAVAGKYGKGRSCFLVLGHDAAAIDNPGFRLLFTRGVEWAAAGFAQPLQWSRDEHSLSLSWYDKVVWRFNHDPKFGKPFFDPVAVPNQGRESFTVAGPADHAWHYGLWFSWKFINGVNYWEEDPNTRKSEGLTTWKNVRYEFEGGFYTRISMELEYGLPNRPPVLNEERVIYISPQDPDGGWYTMHWTMKFTARDDVTLDRTPPPGQPGGQPWGGYAGLSVRMRQLNDHRLVTSAGPVQVNEHGHFRGKDRAFGYGGHIGVYDATIAVADHPGNPNFPTPWYAIRDNTMNYLNAAIVHDRPIRMRAGESFTLRYFIYIHAGLPTQEHLKWMADDHAKEGRGAAKR